MHSVRDQVTSPLHRQTILRRVRFPAVSASHKHVCLAFVAISDLQSAQLHACNLQNRLLSCRGPIKPGQQQKHLKTTTNLLQPVWAQDTGHDYALPSNCTSQVCTSLISPILQQMLSLQAVLIPSVHVGGGNGMPGCFTHEGGVSITKGQLFLWELIMTFVLVSTVYAVAVTKPGHGNIGPLAVGFSLFASAFIGEWSASYTTSKLCPVAVSCPLCPQTSAPDLQANCCKHSLCEGCLCICVKAVCVSV